MKQPLKKCFSVIKECQTLELLCRAGEEPLAPIFRFVKSLWPLRGFRPLSSFSTKELSFCINMSDLPVIHSSARTYIFVDALSAALGKMTTCLFFSRAGAFFPHFVEARGGGHYFHSNAHWLPFQWCVTLFYLISFVHFSSPLFSVIYGNKSDNYLGRQRGSTVSARTPTAAAAAAF